MTQKEARITAAARGFASVRAWMNENRRAAKNFASRMSKKGEDRARLQTLIDCLDREYARFNPLC